MLRRTLALVAACLLLGACRADGAVTVTVGDDGSGTVDVTLTLDADAAARVPDLRSQLRLQDLITAGWSITGPSTEADGRVVVSARKPFADPTQLAEVMGEVTGPGGVLQDVRLEHDRSFGRTRWTFDATVDLTKGIAAFSDDQIAALLGGQVLGRDPGALEKQTGGSIAANTSLTVAVLLPGEISGNAAVVEGQSGRWLFHLDQPGPAPLRLVGTTSSRPAVLWAGVTIAAAGFLVFLLFVRFVRGGRSRRLDVEVPPETTAPPQRRLELVVLDGDGVVFVDRDPIANQLAPFVSERGGTSEAGRVHEAARRAMSGQLTSAELWTELGVAGDPALLDAAYTARHHTNEGVDELVASLAQRGIGVACVTDDLAEWSALLRARFGFDATIRPWVVSGEVGGRRPDPRAFYRLADRAGVTLANCLYIDDNEDNLDVALRLGMSTVLFGPRDGPAQSRHRHVSSFAELLEGARR